MTMRRLNRYEVIEIRRLSGIENFVSERDNFIFNSCRNFEPVKRFQKSSDVLKFWSLYKSSSKSILDVLETIYLIFRKTIVKRVTVVKLGLYGRGGSCFGGVKVEVGTDTAKSTGYRHHNRSRSYVRELEIDKTRFKLKSYLCHQTVKCHLGLHNRLKSLTCDNSVNCLPGSWSSMLNYCTNFNITCGSVMTHT